MLMLFGAKDDIKSKIDFYIDCLPVADRKLEIKL